MFRFITNESVNINLKFIYYKGDIIGLVRPYCLYINLAKDILSGKLKNLKTPLPSSVIKMLDKLGGGVLNYLGTKFKFIG